jgi:Tfp pilus assembly protein PilN
MTTRVNLLPNEFSRKRERRRQVTLLSAYCIMAVVLMLMAQQAINVSINQINSRLEIAQATVAHIENTNDEMSRQQAAITAIKEIVFASEELEQADVPLALLQVVGDSRFEAGSSICLDSLRLDESISQPTNKSKNESKQSLSLAGSGESDDAVSVFVAMLQASNAFRQVELQSSQAQNDQSSNRSFLIRCSQ